MSKISEKKIKIINYIKKHLKYLDPDGVNIQRYEEMFNKMSDKKFDEFMKTMRDGTWEFHIVIPNMGSKYTQEDILAAAKSVGLKLFQRIWFTDKSTGVKYLSRMAYPIIKIPVRRMQQFLDKKMSVPDNDTTIDGLTGQVTADDKSCSVSSPEIQGLHARGLKNILDEFVVVRGGDIESYSEAKRQLEEQGEVRLTSLSTGSVSRTAMMTQMFLESMHIESNLVTTAEGE